MYWIFAAGTGVIPIIDLVFLTLRYIVYKISAKFFREKNNILLEEDVSFFQKNIFPDYSLNLCVSFKDVSSAICLDVFKELQNLNSSYGMNIFNLHVRFSREEKWNEQFIKEKLFKNAQSDIEKVYIIGPSKFCFNIKSELKKFQSKFKDWENSVICV